MNTYLLVGMGGFLGSIARYQIGLFFLHRWGINFPYGTLTVNVLGSLCIGILLGSVMKQNQPLALFLATGFCGGFTTFSTFSMENIRFLEQGNYLGALGYMAISLVGALGACALGFLTINRLLP